MLRALALHEVTLSPLLSTFVLNATVHLLSPLLFTLYLSCYCSLIVFKRFSTAKAFLKTFCGSFGIGVFVSSDTCKRKTAYIRISSDPA